MYHSKAAAKRRKRRNRQLRMRNTLILWGGIWLGAALAIPLGLLIVRLLMPDHPWFR